jgi:hypothetical protein
VKCVLDVVMLVMFCRGECFFGRGLLRSIINLGAFFMCDISRDVAPLPRTARHAYRATGLWHLFRLLRSGA